MIISDLEHMTVVSDSDILFGGTGKGKGKGKDKGKNRRYSRKSVKEINNSATVNYHVKIKDSYVKDNDFSVYVSQENSIS